MHDVEDSWNRIVAWLRRHAPVSAGQLGSPAVRSDIALVEARLDRQLPADLLGGTVPAA